MCSTRLAQFFPNLYVKNYLNSVTVRLSKAVIIETIGSFVVDMAVLLYRFVRRKRTHKRMVREEVGTTTSENKQGRA